METFLEEVVRTHTWKIIPRDDWKRRSELKVGGQGRRDADVPGLLFPHCVSRRNDKSFFSPDGE